MAILSEGEVTVRRNGELLHLKREDLVLGDLMVLAMGDQLPLDGVIRETKGVELDESLITGEPNPISKSVDDPVTSGSFIVSGQAIVQVTAIGSQSYVHQLTEAVPTEKARHDSVLLNIINRIIKILTIVIIPLGVILFTSKLMIHGSDLNQAILGTSAAMIGMIPEGLVLLTSVALAVSARKLANRNVLVRELPAIETLARVDTLCLDKTGTITSGNLVVNRILPLGGQAVGQLQVQLSNLTDGIYDHNATAEALRRFFYQLLQSPQKKSCHFLPLVNGVGPKFKILIMPLVHRNSCSNRFRNPCNAKSKPILRKVIGCYVLRKRVNLRQLV